MAVRRLAEEQPESFAFTPENRQWAERKIAEYPVGRQMSAVIPLMWRAQAQHGWLPEPAIRYIADMLDMPYIRALEVATFYTMFQLSPVGRVAHVQVCGTTPCMLRGAEDLIGICRQRIANDPFVLSADGALSWEEVECAGACVNAPMVQIGSDTFEDLTPDSFSAVLDGFLAGAPPAPGPQSARRSSEPITGATTLLNGGAKRPKQGGSAASDPDALPDAGLSPSTPAARKQSAGRPNGSETPPEEVVRSAPAGVSASAGAPKGLATPDASDSASAAHTQGARPPAAAEGEEGDNLQKINGVGPKLEAMLHDIGIRTFAQIAAWEPDHVAWVDSYLDFKGRVARDEWIEQARSLAKGSSVEPKGSRTRAGDDAAD